MNLANENYKNKCKLRGLFIILHLGFSHFPGGTDKNRETQSEKDLRFTQLRRLVFSYFTE